MDNKKCPICEIDLSHPFPLFCEQCGWDLKHDITLVPSLHEIPENILENYQKRAEISRKIWMERLGAVKRQKELEEEIERLRAERNALEGQKESKEKRKVQEKTDITIEDYTKAIQLNPSYAAIHNMLGAIYHDKGKYDQAIEDYTKAIQLDPNDAVTYQNRGCAYHDKGKYEQAIEDFTKAIQLDPNCVVAYKPIRIVGTPIVKKVNTLNPDDTAWGEWYFTNSET